MVKEINKLQIQIVILNTNNFYLVNFVKCVTTELVYNGKRVLFIFFKNGEIHKCLIILIINIYYSLNNVQPVTHNVSITTTAC